MALIHAQAHSLIRLPLRTWLLASCSALDSWQHRGQCFPRPPPRQRQTQTVGRTRQSKSPEKDAASKEEKLPQELFPASAPPQRHMLLMLHVT